MPSRLTRVRVSVREQTAGKDATTGVPTPSYAHKRYQTLRALYPMSGEEVFRVARNGHDADWAAVTRSRPVIPDTARLVTFIDGEVELILDVKKVTRRGRLAKILLKEVGAAQS